MKVINLNINLKIKKYYLLISLLMINLSILTSYKVDLIVFSYDRPLQLYAFLESAEQHITNLGQVSIIYRTSSSEYDQAYCSLQQHFKGYKYLKQKCKNKEKPSDFKTLVLEAWKSPNQYLMFATDDIIVVDKIDLSMCVQAIKQTDAYGFYLRLGKNITTGYRSTKEVPIPKHKLISLDVYAYQFKDGTGAYWNYPNTVDMTIYPKTKIQDFFFSQMYLSPNQCEGLWSTYANLDQIGLFFEHSKVINIPINSVNEDWTNANMGLYSTKDLLQLFKKGFKIDLKDSKLYDHNCPHVDYPVKFINSKSNSL